MLSSLANRSPRLKRLALKLNKQTVSWSIKPMSRFLCKTIRYYYTAKALGETSHSYVISARTRWFSEDSQNHSFTVTYLMNSLGFSQTKALSASKHVNFESSERPNKTLEFLRNFGLTQTQISTLVRQNPSILVWNIERTVLPKLEYLKSNGFSDPEMLKLLCSFPTVLNASLANQIKPSFDLIKRLLRSDDKAVVAVKRFPFIVARNLKHIGPNVEALRERGVSDSNIVSLLKSQPRCFITGSDQFRTVVGEVIEMGFDPSRFKFVVAIQALLTRSEATWRSKFEAFEKWGLAKDEVLKAFRKDPRCMLVSAGKITASMDFFVNEMGYEPGSVAERPINLVMGLKRRVIPRYSVFRALVSKGLVRKEETSLALLFESPEKKFLRDFVARYAEEAPEVSDLYEKKMSLSNGSEIRYEESRGLFRGIKRKSVI